MDASFGPVKRSRGRPKGSKNDPTTAGAVGRPYKNGAPPKKRNVTQATPSSGVSPSSLVGTPVMAQALSPAAEPNTTVAEEGSLPAPVETSAGTSKTMVGQKPSPHDTAHTYDLIGAKESALDQRKDVDVEVDGVGATNLGQQCLAQPKTRHIWAPSKGVGICDAFDENIDDEDVDDEELDVLFGGSMEDWMSEEFEQIPDDDEDDESQTASTTKKSENPSKQIRTYTALPAWLSQDYADTREQLLGEMKKNVSRKPSCYDKGTFMDSSSYPFFVAAKKFQLQPEHFYKPKSEKGKNGQPVCLTPNGFPKAPRQVVDLDENIYIIGYRYKCQNCRKTYQSWSPALLNVMLRTVAQQFTHHLIYRGGLTDRVVSLMQGCFLQGMGPNSFAQMIRTNHIRHYEQLYLQYLEFIYAQHLGKLNGVPVFTALHTVVNEYNEIRSMIMTPTKAHSQYMPALQEIPKSLNRYGHEPIQLAFTDNP